MVKTFKFKFTLFNNEGNVEDEGTYKSLADIVKDYPNISYSSLYYISNYDEATVKRKPNKNISALMKRIKIERVNNEDIFQKKE